MLVHGRPNPVLAPPWYLERLADELPHLGAAVCHTRSRSTEDVRFFKHVTLVHFRLICSPQRR